MADNTGRCVNCGFLGKLRRQVDAESIVYPATRYDRENGTFYRHSGWPDQRDIPTQPTCFRNAANLLKELTDALNMAEQKDRNAENEHTLAIIEKSRECEFWYPWTEYHSPKEHFEEFKMLELERRREELEQKMDKQFNHILLEPVQEELLILVVEAARNLPREERQKFLVVQTNAGDFIIHPSIKEGENRIYYGDIEELQRQGLLAIGFGSGRSPNFDITSLGFRHYEHLKRKKGEAVERVETTIREYLNVPEFRTKYPEAFAKWSSAEDLLWQTDTQRQLTTIGHLCREALQGFVTTLVERYQPPDVNADKTKTIARLKTVLGSNTAHLGKTKKDFLETLLAYWATVNNLIQRQEHGAYKDGEQLVWEDARRVVFQTMIIMFEIDKSL